jgi:hypothetical protein
MSISYYNTTSAQNNNVHQKTSNNNVCHTLPITCQICLGKVNKKFVSQNIVQVQNFNHKFHTASS